MDCRQNRATGNVKHDVIVFLDIIFMPGKFILGENLCLKIWETQTMGNLKCGYQNQANLKSLD